MPHRTSSRRRPALRARLWITLLALLLVSPALAADGERGPATQPNARAEDATSGELIFDRWYVLRLKGQKAGHAHISRRRVGERLITRNDTTMQVRRGRVTMRIQQRMRFVETVQGEPIEAESTMQLGKLPIVKTMRFEADHIKLTSRQGQREQAQTQPRSDKDWLPPAAAQRYAEKRIAEGAEKIELRTLDPSMGPDPFTMTMRVQGETEIEVMGKVVPAVEWRAEISALPGMQLREYVDRRGRPLKTTMQVMPGMTVTMIESDKDVALADAAPPEMLALMLITPDGALDSPRELRQATYELRLKEEASVDSFDLPRAGYQRVVWGDDRTARVVIDLERPVAPKDDLPTDAHRAATTMLDHDDPELEQLVRDQFTGASGDGTNDLAPKEVASRLRRFVHNYLEEKDLSVGMATASEVVRTKQGDCTEHAVLLAAMLRDRNIPSRVASGLIYVDRFLGRESVFGGHMWTQAWLPVDDDGGHAWVDLDPTLPERDFDAAHLTLSVSAMGEQWMGNTLVRQLPLMQALDIRVVASDAAAAQR